MNTLQIQDAFEPYYEDRKEQPASTTTAEKTAKARAKDQIAEARERSQRLLEKHRRKSHER